MTTFASILQEWMWSKRPPLNISEFADLLGLGRSTVWNWIHAGRVPNVDRLALIHEKTGLPLQDLYAAAGYPIPELNAGNRPDSSPEALARFLTSLAPDDRLEYIQGVMEALKAQDVAGETTGETREQRLDVMERLKRIEELLRIATSE